jgi:hypothetical protein
MARDGDLIGLSSWAISFGSTNEKSKTDLRTYGLL